MRLEGVRRGSTTVGYFDLVGDNAITRTISSQAFRRDHGSPQALAYGQVHGVIDLPRTLDDVQEAIMPYLVELLLSYVDEVFSYISVAFCNQVEKMEPLDNPNSRSSSVHSEIKEQYTRVGGVAVEFCVHIKRTDILFDEIFSKFVAVQQRGIITSLSLLVLNASITTQFDL